MSLLVCLLDSELSDYGLSWRVSDIVGDRYEIDILLNGELKCTESFKIESDNVYILMGEGHWESTCECDNSIRFFWMKIAPEVWGK